MDPYSGNILRVKFNAQQGAFVLTAKVKNADLTTSNAGDISTAMVVGEDAFLNTQQWRLNKKGKVVTP